MLYGRSPFGESRQSVLAAQLRATVEIPTQPPVPPQHPALLGRLRDR
jgi:hypothetical protein